MVIGQSFVDEIVQHAREGAPEEVCGLLARDATGKIVRSYRITNGEHSERFYVMDSQEQLKALLDIDNSDLETAAVYHSHPASEPRPSQHDIALAKWPGVRFLIVSLRDPQNPEIRIWDLDDGNVVEDQLTIDR